MLFIRQQVRGLGSFVNGAYRYTAEIGDTTPFESLTTTLSAPNPWTIICVDIQMNKTFLDATDLELFIHGHTVGPTKTQKQ